MKKILTAAIVLFGIVALTLPAYAAPITFNYSSEFSGGTAPAGTSPWITATFESISATQVKLTFSGANLVGSEKVGEWDFNFNPTKTLANLAIAYVSGTAANSVSKGVNAYKADGDGYYDIEFSFPTSGDTFGAGDLAVYTLTLAAGLVPEDFKFLSDPSGGAGPFYSAAHVQSIGTAGGSGWVSGDPSTGVLVPEPVTMILLGLGLLGVGIAVRKRS